jgi:hypothetical protein
MDKRLVRVKILEKNVYGSLTQENKYDDDSLLEIRAWIDALLERVPEAYRQSAKLKVEDVSGYEGESHIEVTAYYERPETDDEYKRRIAKEKAEKAVEEQKERAILERLRKKYEPTSPAPKS